MFFVRCIFLLSCAVLSACSTKPDNIALGTLERDRVLLAATAAETIVEQPVAESTFVTAGTRLVKLDDSRQKVRVALAKAQLAQASAQLELLKAGARQEDIDALRAKVEGAEAETVVAEKSFRRLNELQHQNVSSQADLDNAIAVRDSAEAKLKSARKELQRLTNGTRKEELDQAEAAVEAAAAQLALEQQSLKELNVIATRDGYLDSLPFNVGERVSPGATVAVLLAGELPYARVYVPETARATTTNAKTYSVFVDGVEQALQGKLRWIAHEPAFTPYYALNETDRSRLVYLAEFTLETGSALPTGVPVEVWLDEQH